MYMTTLNDAQFSMQTKETLVFEGRLRYRTSNVFTFSFFGLKRELSHESDENKKRAE